MAYPTTVKIKLVSNTPQYNGLEVILPTNHLALLKGKGEGKYILIHKENVKYKHDNENDSDDN